MCSSDLFPSHDKGCLKVGELVSIENKKRLFDYSDWKGVGRVVDCLQSPWKNGLTLNGSNDENRFVYDLDPFGKSIIVWQCVNDAANDDDGGWNSNVPIDNTKKYRFSIWAKRSVAGNGSFFMGCGSVESVAGVTQGNPYWHVAGFSNSEDGGIQSE